MKRVAKPVFFIVALILVLFACASFLGFNSKYGDIDRVYLKGLDDIEWGMDLGNGALAVFAPTDSENVTDQQLQETVAVMEQRLVNKGITDSEIMLDSQNKNIVVRFALKPGEEAVLDNRLPAQDQMDVIDGEDLRPGQEPTFNEQMPGYESEAARMLDDPTPPSYNSKAPEDSQQSEEPLSRRERRKLRKEAKNTPLALPELSKDAYRISGGKKSATYADTEIVISADSLLTVVRESADSLATGILPPGSADSLTVSVTDTLTMTDSLASLTARQRREMERLQRRADTTLYRHSPLFRDTLKIAPLTAISLVAPGFGQLYNGDYWKIPVLYATTGTALFFGIKQHQQYKQYKNEYDYLMSRSDFSDNRLLLDPVQTKMIQHNTWRQVLIGTAVASYIYFLGDAIVNYPAAQQNPVKTATTLSMICPGAGQVYNGSFWKVPLVVGGFASFIYVIDWNNRGYQRYDTAIRLETDDDPDSHSSEFWNPSSNSLSMTVEQMRSYKKLYRRNRDLAIILTAAFYLLNVMDAHVDAHMKDFDVSGDLAWRLQPTVEPLYAMGGYNYAVGLGLSLTF